MSWSCNDRRGYAAALLVAAAAAFGPDVRAQGAAACGAGMPGATVLSGSRDEVAFTITPAPPAVGRRIALDIVVCPRGGATMPDRLRVDATMPEHGHGMNYRPSVSARGDGRWHADGLLLHMRGRWELSIELQRGGQVETLRHDLQLK